MARDRGRDGTGDDYFAGFRDLAKVHPELTRELLGRVMNKVDDLDKRAKFDLVAIVVSAVIFELLNRNLLGEASAFGVKAAKLGFLRFFVPAVIAFLLLRLITTVRDGLLYVHVVENLCRLAYPEVNRSNVLLFVFSSSGILSSLNPPVEFVGRRASQFRDLVDWTELFVVCVAIPVGFSAYAIVQLFRQSEPPYVAALVTLSATVILLAMTVVAVIATVDEGRRRA